MGRIDDVDHPSDNIVSPHSSQRFERYSDMREEGYYPRSYYPRNNYGSQYDTALSDFETVSNPDSPVQKEYWFINFWRPAMAWLYFAIIAFYFIAAPIFTFWFAYLTHIPYIPWKPITLEGGGLIHVSLGAIIGIYTWSRTREKLANMSGYANQRY